MPVGMRAEGARVLAGSEPGKEAVTRSAPTRPSSVDDQHDVTGLLPHRDAPGRLGLLVLWELIAGSVWRSVAKVA
jgi:hypothetical protein